MILNRRSFIRSSVLAGTGLLANPLKGITGLPAPSEALFAVHPFVQENPDAVFIMKTHVQSKTDSAGLKDAGLRFGNSVFGITDDPSTGVPLNNRFVIKPNLTCRATWHSKYSVEASMGIVTDASFTEGIIESMGALGISSSNTFIREVNCEADLEDGGYVDLAGRTGIDLAGIETPYYLLPDEQMQWKEVPEGGYFKRIPYLWPVNSPDSWLLNISKLKAHGMGLTLCAKNIQGTIAMDYQEHCRQYGEHLNIRASDRHDDAFQSILDNYNNRLTQGVPRWDKPGSRGGLWMETWGTRCLDSNAVTKAGLHVIEGIYGRDGNFMDGPGEDGLATDYMCNYIIFGMNAFYVDIIGHWIGGHEPGNFGLFHMAQERGMISQFNPSEIPLYEWDAEQGAKLSDLGDFERTPLKTYYLQKDYDGGDEEKWHMVDEEYDYPSSTGIDPSRAKSFHFSLGEIFPNPVKWKTSIPFQLTKPGLVRMEIINAKGMLIDVLKDDYLSTGNHMVTWQSMNHPAGVYLCRMMFEGGSQVGSIMVCH